MREKLTHIIKAAVTFVTKERSHSEGYYKRVEIFNKYSLVFHAIIALAIVFLIELFSRRSFWSACSFVTAHTMAYLYNAFIVFASLALVYLFKRRSFFRLIISVFWLILGVINGCVLSNRVTPFGYTDLKCISDLLTMTNTNYFTATQATACLVGIIILAIVLVIVFFRGPKFQGKRRFIIAPLSIAALLFIALPMVTSAAQKTNIVASYFTNIAQGYEDYGFVYSFSSSVVGRGMSKPDDYSQSTVEAVETNVNAASAETNTKKPNIIVILMESFVDPAEIGYLEVNEDPIPTIHQLEQEFSTGYLTVPVVGAGTSNSEFEVLTGMSMQYFGTGEYPHKTILKEVDGCEAIASDLSAIGYGTHVVHNNGGNFYSRVNAFSQMGFDTFTSKEMMDITEFTPNGSWAEDAILVDETIKAMDATENQSDMIYTITVGCHGDYPTEAILENPRFTTTGSDTEERKNQWDYYVNQLNKSDEMIRNLIEKLSARDEETIVIAFGDHLPTMDLTDEDMKSGSIYKTQYFTWNNFGLPKNDTDLYAYQLLAHYTGELGIHEGTIFRYHQTQMDSANYQEGLELLQYDLLYGNRYAYEGENLYPKTDIVMGIDDVVISSYHVNPFTGNVVIYGSGFTNWSRVYINGEKTGTTYVSGHQLMVNGSNFNDGDTFTVNQVGSSNTIFRTSNEVVFEDPDATETTETSENSEKENDHVEL